MLTKEQEDFFNNYYAMFRSEGWQQFVEELQNTLQGYSNIEALKNEKDLYTAQGARSILFNILALEELTKDAHKTLEVEDNEEVI